ncbi:MAG: HEAT repeat domain-containing protein [Candidatus Omnitrophica bacterium]|nr:HEAT repeat domain-containing protein [Candidatus Omnitrophota bacterium]
MPRELISKDFWFIVLLVCAIQAFAVSGCSSRGGERDVVPKSLLPSDKQDEMRQILADTDYMRKAARYRFGEKYGEEAVPFMIEKVFETYELGSDWKHPALYSIACNLILSLGEMGDERVFAALQMWLVDKKYRVFRSSAAYALGELGDEDAIDDLWRIWREEKSYLYKGDDEGPWPFFGYHPSGCYVHRVLSEVGEALYKLGEARVVGEIIEVAELSREKGWSSGYKNMIWTLRKIGGMDLSESSYDIQYWIDWWGKNRSKYVAGN